MGSGEVHDLHSLVWKARGSDRIEALPRCEWSLLETLDRYIEPQREIQAVASDGIAKIVCYYKCFKLIFCGVYVTE